MDKQLVNLRGLYRKVAVRGGYDPGNAALLVRMKARAPSSARAERRKDQGESTRIRRERREEVSSLVVTDDGWVPNGTLIAPPCLWTAHRTTPPEFLRYACGHLERHLIELRYVIVKNPILLFLRERP